MDDVSGDAIDVGTRTRVVVVVVCVVSCPGSEHARFTATLVPRFKSSINVASFSLDSVEIWVFCAMTWAEDEEDCGETCCTIVCFASPLRAVDVIPDATIVIVLLLVFDIVLTFLALRKASASAKRRVAESGAAGTTNAPWNRTKKENVKIHFVFKGEERWKMTMKTIFYLR